MIRCRIISQDKNSVYKVSLKVQIIDLKEFCLLLHKSEESGPHCKLHRKSLFLSVALDRLQTSLGSLLRPSLQILLVMILSWPELFCLLNLHHYLVSILGLDLLDEVQGNALLFLSVIIYTTSVLSTPVIPLPVEGGGVHSVKENHQQLLVRHHGWVEYHLHPLSVT